MNTPNNQNPNPAFNQNDLNKLSYLKEGLSTSEKGLRPERSYKNNGVQIETKSRLTEEELVKRKESHSRSTEQAKRVAEIREKYGSLTEIKKIKDGIIENRKDMASTNKLVDTMFPNEKIDQGEIINRLGEIKRSLNEIDNSLNQKKSVNSQEFKKEKGDLTEEKKLLREELLFSKMSADEIYYYQNLLGDMRETYNRLLEIDTFTKSKDGSNKETDQEKQKLIEDARYLSVELDAMERYVLDKKIPKINTSEISTPILNKNPIQEPVEEIAVVETTEKTDSEKIEDGEENNIEKLKLLIEEEKNLLEDERKMLAMLKEHLKTFSE